MSGPRIMTLGPFQFESIGFSMDGRSLRTVTPWAELEVAGGQNQLQWTGAKGQFQVIRGVLFDEFGGQASLEGIKIASMNGVALPLIALGGAPLNVFGIYAVEAIEEDHGFIMRGGRALRNGYSIHLRAYPGPIAGVGISSVLTLFS